jgi:hypothetical protein
LLAELFYLRDYWRPPSLFGIATVLVEDFIFGFAITALSFVAYLWIFDAKFTHGVHPPRRKLYGIFFISGIVAMMLFNVLMGINSIL